MMLHDHIVVFLILLTAYFVRGLTGFGSGLISVPLLALWQPLQLVVPLIMVLDFVASFILGGVNTKQTDWSEIKRLLPFGVIGASFGVFALLRFPSAAVLVALGVFTIFFGVRNALGVQPHGQISALWAVPTGLIGSGAGALFGTSAPPYIIYLTHRLDDKTAVRLDAQRIAHAEKDGEHAQCDEHGRGREAQQREHAERRADDAERKQALDFAPVGLFGVDAADP